MNNLIVTIIGIALTAIASVMGIFYGGTAYENAQINATANSIVNEAQQILAAERMWAVNNNQPDISGMSAISYNSGVAYNGSISLLVSGKELAEWPSLAGSIAQPSPDTGNVLTGHGDYGCYKVSGYQGTIGRDLFAYNGGNYVLYQFTINVPYNGNCLTENGSFSSSTADTSEAKHPIVLIAKAINNNLKQIPSEADASTMPYAGLPQPPSGSNIILWVFPLDANGTMQTNYCLLNTAYSDEVITCVFGPS